MVEQKIKNEITSLELLAEINKFRKEEGIKKELGHNDLLKVIRDEFSEEINEGKISPVTYKDKKGEKRPMFILTLSQARQVLVRESKFVRRAVIHFLEKLENQGLENNQQKKLPFSEVKPTTWRGIPVMEVKELSKMIGVPDVNLHWYAKRKKLTLKFDNLKAYKEENSNKNYSSVSAISLLYKPNVISICKRYGLYNKYKDFIDNYFKTNNLIEYKGKANDEFDHLIAEATRIKANLLKEKAEIEEKLMKLNKMGLTN
nr:MAG TPA: KilAC domain protein [Caudoviricetes sp.]